MTICYTAINNLTVGIKVTLLCEDSRVKTVSECAHVTNLGFLIFSSQWSRKEGSIAPILKVGNA